MVTEVTSNPEEIVEVVVTAVVIANMSPTPRASVGQSIASQLLQLMLRVTTRTQSLSDLHPQSQRLVLLYLDSLIASVDFDLHLIRKISFVRSLSLLWPSLSLSETTALE
jgi:hypothetical protein